MKDAVAQLLSAAAQHSLVSDQVSELDALNSRRSRFWAATSLRCDG